MWNVYEYCRMRKWGEKKMITRTPLLQNRKMGGTIDERGARTDKVVIEFPITRNTTH